MSNWTRVNLREVEDMAPRFGYAPHLQSRFARKALELEQSGLGHYTVEPNYRLPFGHRHTEQEEIYLVVRGSVRVKVDDEVVALGAPNTDNADAEMQPGWWPDGVSTPPS